MKLLCRGGQGRGGEGRGREGDGRGGEGRSREGREVRGDCNQGVGHMTCLVLSSHELSGPCCQLGERQARKGGTRWEGEDLGRQRVKGLPNARQCGRTHCVCQEESIVPTEICTSPPAARE